MLVCSSVNRRIIYTEGVSINSRDVSIGTQDAIILAFSIITTDSFTHFVKVIHHFLFKKIGDVLYINISF